MKIVAIGGGEIGRPGTRVETLRIDKEIIALTCKKKPKVLFLPTASVDSRIYIDAMKEYYGSKLGCDVSVLRLTIGKLGKSQVSKRILAADIVYVGGGNTLEMLRIWKAWGVDVALVEAARRGIVLTGVSAGAVCWFQSALSDAKKMVDPKADYVKISCLGLVPLFVCPHFDKEKGRAPALRGTLKKGGSAIAIDNCAAIEIVGDSYRILASKRGAFAYRCRWNGNRYETHVLGNAAHWRPLTELTMKR